jgi:hypothetical protein
MVVKILPLIVPKTVSPFAPINKPASVPLLRAVLRQSPALAREIFLGLLVVSLLKSAVIVVPGA